MLMSKHAYLLVFDRDDFLDYKTIHEKIISIDGLLNWFHYIKSSYILITNEPSAKQLARKIQPFIPQKTYLLVEIDMNNRQGWLPPKAWDWIKKQVDIINDEDK